MYSIAGDGCAGDTGNTERWPGTSWPTRRWPSTTTATAPKKVKFKKNFDVKATVTAAGTTPTGTVEVWDGSKKIGSGTLANGTVTIHITKNLKPKKHTLTVKYLGSASVNASQTTVKVKIKKKKRHHHR